MLNKLSDTKIFNDANKVFKYTKKMTKIDFNNFKIDPELYSYRLNNIKTFKFPLVKEIVSSIEKGLLSQCAFNHSKVLKAPTDLFLDKYLPKSLITLPINTDKGIQILTNISSKGKYIEDNKGKLVGYDIPDITLYYFNLAAYINLLCITTNISQKHTFFTLISEAYALLLSRCIDKYYPISMNGVDSDKIYIITACFCLESMFNLSKEDAINYALKMKVVSNKNVINELIYYKSDITMTSDCDFTETFPIDNLCQILKNEFNYISSDKFNSVILIRNYVNMFYDNAGYALEDGQSFINMLILALGRMKIYEDYKINKILEISRKDFIKELGVVLSDK